MEKEYDNPWTYNGKPVLEIDKEYYGFVYLISFTDNEGNIKKYIGKKSCKQKRKDKKTGRRKTTESDWRNYYSSCEFIKKTAKKNKLMFKREILRFCKTKGEMNFFEIEEQFKRDVLKSNFYLNDQILGRYFKSNIIRYGK